MKCYAGCGTILPAGGKFRHKGHILADFHGGSRNPENIRIICETCNLTMRTEHMFDWMKSYSRYPPTPDPAFISHKFDKNAVIKPIKYQHREIRYNIVTNIFSNTPVKGIIDAATGSGKTSMCIEGVGKFLPGKLLLWITGFKRVLESQFTMLNIKSWKDAGFIPRETSIQGKRALKFCESFPGTCIIHTTIATALKDSNYRKICHDPRFLGFVIDESHHSDAPETSKMLLEMTSLPTCEIAIGLSATHISTPTTKKIFGETPFLASYTLMEAWRDGVIREVKIQCCMLQKDEKESSKDSPTSVTLFNKINNKKVLLKNLKSIIDSTQTKKGILWCDWRSEADKWGRYLSDKLSKDDRYKQIQIYIDHTEKGEKESSEIGRIFRESDGNAIMIAAQKYAEGVDIKHLDFAGVISGNINSSDRIYLQRVGRILRYEGRPGPAIFCNFAVTTDLDDYTKKMRSVFIDFYHGAKEMLGPTNDLDFYERVHFTSGNRIECTNGRKNAGEVTIMFEFLDDMHVIEIFEKQDAEFVAEMLYKTGHGISFNDIKELLRNMGIKSPAEAQKFLNNCSVDEFPKICKWWDIAKFLPMDYTKLLDLDDSGCYQTLAEAKSALKKLEKTLSLNELKLPWNEKYKLLLAIDSKLPLNWQNVYNINNVKEYWNPDIEMLKKKY
jgi:superfamily II DNA or RNA helicase